MSAWPYVAFYNPTLKLLAKEGIILGRMAENKIQFASMTIHSIL